ncbi:MAG: formyltetrahydrofolate deformylase, partial [Oxalobacteraceae bacterium]
MRSTSEATPPTRPEYILHASCPAGIGIVAAVATFLAERDCYICALEQFDDDSTARFFMRAVFRQQDKSPAIDAIRAEFDST